MDGCSVNQYVRGCAATIVSAIHVDVFIDQVADFGLVEAEVHFHVGAPVELVAL